MHSDIGRERSHWLSSRKWEGKKGSRENKTRKVQPSSAFLRPYWQVRAMPTVCRHGGSDKVGHTGVFPPGNSLSLEHCFPVWRVMKTTVDPICFFSSVEPTLCCRPCGFIGTTGSLEKQTLLWLLGSLFEDKCLNCPI